MAEFEKMIPFVLHFAAGVYGKNGKDLELPYNEQFALARNGGWSDDPDDPGGATMIDVTIATYCNYREKKGYPITTKDDLREICYEDWREILKTMYWDLWRGDEILSQGVAHLLVDWIWASGGRTIRNVQRYLGVSVDGKVGPETINALNKGNQDDRFRDIRDMRERYYRGCRGAWKYLKGWLRRLDSIQPDGSFII